MTEFPSCLRNVLIFLALLPWGYKLNHKPRKCLNRETPYEVFYDKIVLLNLIIQNRKREDQMVFSTGELK